MKKVVYLVVLLLFGIMLISGCNANTPNTGEIPTDVVEVISTDIPTAEPTAVPTQEPTEVLPTVTPTEAPKPITVKSVAKVVPGPYDIMNLGMVPNNFGPNLYLNEDQFGLIGWHTEYVGLKQVSAPCSDAKYAYGVRARTNEYKITKGDVVDMALYDVFTLFPAQKGPNNGFDELAANEAAVAIISQADQLGLPIYANCAGVPLLGTAGVIRGESVGGLEMNKNDILAAGATFVGEGAAPEISNNIVTATRDFYYHVDNSEAFAAALEQSNPFDEVTDKPGADETASLLAPLDETLWTQTYGGTSADSANAIVIANDGGLTMLGYTISFGAGYTDMYLVHTDANGTLLWAKTYGDAGWQYGQDLVNTPDGGYMLVGYTNTGEHGLRDVLAIKTDANGELLWQKTYGGEGYDLGRSVAVVDGGYVIIGSTESFGAGENDVYALMINEEGEEVWSQTFGAEGPEMGSIVISTSDGGVLIAGSTGSKSLSSGNRDIYAIMLDASGAVLWEKTFGGSTDSLPFEWTHGITETSDGGFVLVGHNNKPLDGNEWELLNVDVRKIDKDGNQVWEKYYGETVFYDYGFAVTEADNGDLLVLGANKTKLNNKRMYLLRLTADGDEIWRKRFGGKWYEWGSDIVKHPDGGFVLAGYANSFGAGSYDMWVVRLDDLME